MDYLEKVFDVSKVWAYILCSIVAFFKPVGIFVLWLFIFTLIDLVIGVIASMREGKYMTSSGLRKTSEKFFYYFLTIFLIEGIDKYMVGWGGMAKIFAGILCVVEFYSILENFYRITGHRSFRILTQFTCKKIEEKIGIKIDEEDEPK